jgi:hypothetical protein
VFFIKPKTYQPPLVRGRKEGMKEAVGGRRKRKYTLMM